MITQIRKKDKIIISVRHGVSSTCVKKKKGKKTEKRGKDSVLPHGKRQLCILCALKTSAEYPCNSRKTARKMLEFY